MKVGFDPGKDASNRAKHGLSLSRAGELDLLAAFVLADDRLDYGEPRWRAYGMMDGRLHMLAFTFRDGMLRAISLRRANARECKRYG
ncbi:MAG: BrnT family toxin [Candidatus Brevundimonas colombiensis]|uniref:BrnT family toxin n=1 Tax=Candidatus Brevundimonas colombiensis TaxID=3121376 RepID=A0AAJ5WY07_9CAUL|nr:BrnT family toxin [Brevundimonas sp.]WEK40421.1 MAG: BrnT family toxin [Brevundimonas sp.]